MTTLPLTNDEADLAAVAAEAAAKVIPAPEALRPLTPMAATPGLASGFAGAVLAELDELPGRIAVLVGGELVTALSQSPIGGLDLAAALQPTLDAVARTLGTLVVGARAVDPSLVISDLGEDVTAVPLMGREPVAAILLSKAALSAATSPATEPEPALARGGPGGPGGERVRGHGSRYGDRRCPRGRSGCARAPSRHRAAARRRHGGDRRDRPHPDDRA